MSTNLKGRKNCKAVVDNAVKAMGGVDILVNNATYQMMVNDIKDLSVSEYVSSPASLISPFSTIRYKLVNVFQASPSYNNYKSTANPPMGPPLLLHGQIHAPASLSRQCYHQQRIHKRLH